MTTSSVLQAGDTTPDFALRGTDGSGTRTYRLGEVTDDGQWVFLTFYAFDFNPTCTEGLCALRDAEFFEVYGDLTALGISGDGIHSHERFARQYDINYPLLSDTGRDVAEQYGAVRDEYEGMRRVHRRAVFVIDDSRTIRLATTIDADSPEDIALEPINEALHEIRG